MNTFYAETDYGFRPHEIQAKSGKEAVDIAKERYGNSLMVVYEEGEEAEPGCMNVFYERK